MSRPYRLALALLLSSAPAFAQPAPQAPDAGGAPRTFGGVAEDRILDAIRTGRIVGRQNVGSTSVNLHLRLAGDIDAAWKPRTSTHGETYRAEIAAYRLNRMLGLARVPPAVSRTIPRAALHLAPTSPVIAERDNTVRGAAIYWVPVLRDSLIDRPREIERWSSWLRQGREVPADQRARAEEISTLLVFDFLTGNWDRWSGSNVPMDAAGHLIYRDNNGAFEEPFVLGLMQNGMSWLRRAQRFSASVIARARALTDASIREEMALDGDPAHPPLTEAQRRSLLRRRDALMQYVDGLIRRHGEAAVLAF
ncbi:MAG: hypothetical protein U0325_20690 [Polyangiales bacterium]